jgi:murein DD-endopeptidase MepM/ murein hydrolase activator NlpD
MRVTVLGAPELYGRPMRKTTLALVSILAVQLATAPAASPASASGGWTWPVVGPVIRGFDPPASPYGSGHRGIDIATDVGTTVLAPAAGKVTFAGPVAGHLFMTIDHGGGVESTYSWLSALLVRKGAVVRRGQPVAGTGWGHPSSPIPHLHFGVKLLDVYVDPMRYLQAASLSSFIRLAPLT